MQIRHQGQDFFGGRNAPGSAAFHDASEIFGLPNSATVKKMKKIAGTDVLMKVNPSYLGGFIREVKNAK